MLPTSLWMQHVIIIYDSGGDEQRLQPHEGPLGAPGTPAAKGAPRAPFFSLAQVAWRAERELEAYPLPFVLRLPLPRA